MSENKILDIEYDEVSVYVKLEDVSINKDIMQSSILGARDYILKYLEENIQELVTIDFHGQSEEKEDVAAWSYVSGWKIDKESDNEN